MLQSFSPGLFFQLIVLLLLENNLPCNMHNHKYLQGKSGLGLVNYLEQGSTDLILMIWIHTLYKVYS